MGQGAIIQQRYWAFDCCDISGHGPLLQTSTTGFKVPQGRSPIEFSKKYNLSVIDFLSGLIDKRTFVLYDACVVLHGDSRDSGRDSIAEGGDSHEQNICVTRPTGKPSCGLSGKGYPPHLA
jgi:hypothetical protein